MHVTYFSHSIQYHYRSQFSSRELLRDIRDYLVIYKVYSTFTSTLYAFSANPVQIKGSGTPGTHPLKCLGTRSTHFPCIEIRRAARAPQKGQNGCLAVRPGWRPSGVIAEARNARPSMSDMPWLGPARLPPSRSPRSIRPPRSVRAVERASEPKWRFFRRRASAQPVRLSPSQGKPPPSLS